MAQIHSDVALPPREQQKQYERNPNPRRSQPGGRKTQACRHQDQPPQSASKGDMNPSQSAGPGLKVLLNAPDSRRSTPETFGATDPGRYHSLGCACENHQEHGPESQPNYVAKKGFHRNFVRLGNKNGLQPIWEALRRCLRSFTS